MNFKRYFSLVLACIMIFFSSSIVNASPKNTNKEIDKFEKLKISVKGIKADTSGLISKEAKDGKTIINLPILDMAAKNNNVTKAVAENHPPIADLRYSILNPTSLNANGNLTTDTQVAWLWSYNGTKFTYDPDGDAITNMEVGGIPSASILSYVVDNQNNRIGFVMKISTTGNYTMTFRCKDEHGLWSNIWSQALYIAPTITLPKAIAAGNRHSAVLRENSTVWTWGSNEFGELGNGTTTDSVSPVQITGLSGVKAIGCGLNYTVALKQDGTVWTWGRNEYGQLGNGTTVSSTTPVQVAGLSGVKAISSGGGLLWSTVALKEDGTVWAWGYNGNGQLGNGTTVNSTTPVQVVGLSGVKAIAAGGYFTTALKEDGTVWAWGTNDYGELGNGTTVANSSIPVQVTGLTNVKAIANGDIHGMALKQDGTVWVWGNNTHGQLGDGTSNNRNIPIRVTSLSGVKAIAGAYFHSVVLREDGTVYVWGASRVGQLLKGWPIDRTPVMISGLTGVNEIAAGCYHTLALKSDKTVWACGDNDKGQLGDGTTVDKSSPVKVIGLN